MKEPDLTPLKVEDIGLDNGLTVTVNNHLEDYMVSAAPPAGAKVNRIKSSPIWKDLNESFDTFFFKQLGDNI